MTAVKIFSKDNAVANYTLKSQDATVWGNADATVTAKTDGYMLVLQMEETTGLSVPGANDKTSYRTACIGTSADHMHMICSACGITKGASSNTSFYKALYANKVEDNKKAMDAAADVEVTLTSGTNYASLDSVLKISHAWSGTTDYKVCKMEYYQPTEADTYTNNYRFGGQTAIKVKGAYGMKADQTSFGAVTFMKNSTEAVDISGAATLAFSAAAATVASALLF